MNFVIRKKEKEEAYLPLHMNYDKTFKGDKFRFIQEPQ